MKTRIVNPSLWENDKISELSKDARIAISFLINNPKLGLTRYAYITDKYATYSTGLNLTEWTKAKDELQEIKWCYFKDGWVYQNHEFAYLDYFGRDRVMKSKDEELDRVPMEIQDYFKGLISGLLLLTKESINHKPINHKQDINNIYNCFGSITEKEIIEISQKYKVPESFVLSKLDDIDNWEDEKPGRMKGRNWKRTLMNWVKRDALQIKTDYAKQNSDISL